MVNYDLPWNPNRIEQRFGRIHRIGQTEVCHLWNLVAARDPRGRGLRAAPREARGAAKALGGRSSTSSATLFREQPLRDLLIEAVRYGEQPRGQGAPPDEVVDAAVGENLKEAARAPRAVTGDDDAPRTSRRSASEMERARPSASSRTSSRLLPRGVRPPRRPHPSASPAATRSPTCPGASARDRQIGVGAPVVARYERICFDKPPYRRAPGAAFSAPVTRCSMRPST